MPDKTRTQLDLQVMLRQARQASGISRREAASLLGVTANSIRNWERGVSTPRLADAERAMEVYGWTLFVSSEAKLEQGGWASLESQR